MRFSILTGNHNSQADITDTVTFLKCALMDCGLDAQINPGIARDRVNVVLEHFPDEASIRAIEMARDAGARFVIVGTEPIIDCTFNRGVVSGHWHYGDAANWKRRYDNFIAAAAHADAIWVLAEEMVPQYRAVLPGKPVLFLPHGHVTGFRRFEHRPAAWKDIDFYSSGTLTDYRRGIVEALAARGHRVLWDPLGTADYLRHDHLSRAKICLSLRLSPSNEIPSVSRMHFHLEHASYLMHERYARPCPLDPYVLHLPPAEIVEWGEAALQVDDRRETAEAISARFFEEMPMSRLLPPILEASLHRMPLAA
jgi:hypothetical protein